MPIILDRRAFTFGVAGATFSAALPSRAFAQDEQTRSVTTIYGTYDIPAFPLRVVAIDSRLDLQPALALGLPVIGYGHSQPGSWVPLPEGLEFYGSEVNIEQVLASDPDLIICAAYNPDSSYWPANRLMEVGPVVPTAIDTSWKDAFRQLAMLLGMDGAGEQAIAEYDAVIADIRARHGEKLTSRTVVSIQPGDGVLQAMTGSRMLQPQVLADLGAKTIPPLPDQHYNTEIPAEAFGDFLGEVDGILLATTSPEGATALDGNPLWQRLPAVQAGALIASNGNINYGSIYSAIHVARLIDELYTMMA